MEAYIWVLIFTTCASLVVMMMKLCFASKCQDIKLCYGMVDIHRDTSHEMRTIDRMPSQEVQSIK